MQKVINFSSTTLKDRIDSIQNVNDPNTISDNILRWANPALWVSILFSGILSVFAYFKFLETAFGPTLSVFMALSIAALIEFGKGWGAKKFLRIAFFQGWSSINGALENMIVFVVLACLTFATFFASVYNSTHGAKELSVILQNEKNSVLAFRPDTKALDEQISGVNSSIEKSEGIKWKGATTYQAQRAINAQSKALTALSEQRAEQIRQQRQDFERLQSQRDGKTKFSSETMLLVGGFIEIISAILLLLIVASEKSLVARYYGKAVPQSPQQKTVHKTSDPMTGSADPFQTRYSGIESRTRIGFKYGQNQDEKAVPQSPQQKSDFMNVFADKSLNHLKRKFQTEIPNLYRRDANRETVGARIHEAINSTFQEMNVEGYNPSKEVIDSHLDYFQNYAFPAITGAKVPYSSDKEFLQQLQSIADRVGAESN